MLVKIPPGQTILGKEKGGVLAKQGLELVQHPGKRMGFNGDNHKILEGPRISDPTIRGGEP